MRVSNTPTSAIRWRVGTRLARMPPIGAATMPPMRMPSVCNVKADQPSTEKKVTEAVATLLAAHYERPR